MVRTLARKAVGITSGEQELKQERKVLRTALEDCDYPAWAVDKGMSVGSTEVSEQVRNENTRQERDKGFVSLPYVSGTTEAIGRVLGNAGFKVAMKPCRTLRQELVAPKDVTPTMEKAGVVYQIGCKDCDATYIGHTSKNLKDRVKQHRSATDKDKTIKSGVAEHAWTQHCVIDWLNVKVLVQESQKKRRQIKQSLLIKSSTEEMHRDSGIDLSIAFLRLIHRSEGPTQVMTTRVCSPDNVHHYHQKL